MPTPSIESDRSSVSSRSTASRASRQGKRTAKKPVGLQAVVEPVEERKLPFTPDMLAGGLSQLGRTADGLKPAYLTLTLTGTDLASADPLAAFPHLQSLYLADNRLAEIRGLGALRNLTHVDVSGNKLTQVLDLRLGPDGSGPTNLRSADFSRNQLDMLRDLSSFSRLTSLALSFNRIERVGSGLSRLGMLKVLDLSCNRLVSCRGLEGLVSLQELRLQNNRLQSLEMLSGLSQLQVLVVSNNRLRHLAGVESLSALRTLDVSYNLLVRLEELVAVQGAPLLGSLDIRGNPLDKAMSLRLHVVHLLPQVIMLDGVAVDSKEKVLAANMHGADAEGLRLIRRKYFPNGELLDGGGAIPPLAAGLVASQAEEESAADGADRNALLRLDAWAASVRPESVLGPGASLITLADQLASICTPPKPMSATDAAAAAAAGAGGGGAAGGASGAGGAGAARGLGGSLPSTPSRGSRSPLAALAAAVAAGAAAAAGADQQPQLQRARVCWRWVVTHVAPMARLESTWDVEQPLFGHTPQAAAIERVLLGDRPPSPPPGPTPVPGASATAVALPAPNIDHTRSHPGSTASVSAGGGGGRPPATAPAAVPAGYGTFAERVARLFTLLCRACELDAVPIPGYWKHSRLAPGDRVEAHNHCWAGVKVNGRWRLVDPTAAALAGGHCPFFVPPDAFIYSYWPLEAAWQLLPEPLSQEIWWQLPYASVAFFSEGCQLGDAKLEAVNVLPAVREGGVLPAFQVDLAVPRAKGAHLHHRLLEARSGRVVAEWPPKEPGVPAYAFQQVVAGKKGSVDVRFGAEGHQAQQHQLWVSLPAPGEYQMEVTRVRELPGGGLRVPLEGVPAPGVQLRVVDEQLLLRVKVVLPAIAPHDEDEDGILHSPAVLRSPLPYASSFFVEQGCQLVSPPPHHPLEADRSEPFNVVVPGATRVGLMAEGLRQLIELPPVDDAGGTFATSLQVPRSPTCTLMAYVHDALLSSCAWIPLVQMRVLPQSQHMVYTPTPLEVQQVDPNDPHAARAREIFRTMDKNIDGLVSRREILTAFRRNRQHADILKCPARIRQHDGTFEKFVDVYMQIDTNKLGNFTFNELASYMGVKMYDSEEEEYEEGDEGEEEEIGGEGLGAEEAGEEGAEEGAGEADATPAAPRPPSAPAPAPEDQGQEQGQEQAQPSE